MSAAMTEAGNLVCKCKKELGKLFIIQICKGLKRRVARWDVKMITFRCKYLINKEINELLEREAKFDADTISIC